MKEIRTRFAPSPTGFLHVGGVRTNFYAWLLARHHGGKFILRIEDTDRERFVPGAIKAILDDLKWLGLDIDEGPSTEELKLCDEGFDGDEGVGGELGPYVQSQRLHLYREVADKLIESGHAYRCDCTAEMLQKEREEQMARRESPGYSGYCRSRNVSADTKHVVRIKIPERESMTIDDAVKGKITWEKLSLRDTVILKSDGYPTYHLAVVVDDHHMKISHVMRGEEWISTTPVHVLLYRALGWEMPIFCHLPSVLGQDGKKLSKRHGATQVGAFKDDGYLPEALLNFLLLIGWNPGDGEEQEIFSREEMIERFNLENINTASGVFAYDKLNWMNGVYIRNLSADQFKERVLPFCKKAGLELEDSKLSEILPHVQERTKLLTEVPEMIEFLADKPLERELDQMLKKDMDAEKAISILELAYNELSELSDFSADNIEAAIKKIPEVLDLKMGPAFIVVRIAVTGKKATPPLFTSIQTLGKDLTLARLRETVEILAKKS
ncbi:MAG: glutamate--tRNA ligase [Deltaproteobacteria bacterium]|nr:glutamate--tRNA ligase [Deltaproteobacteria bacterium]